MAGMFISTPLIALLEEEPLDEPEEPELDEEDEEEEVVDLVATVHL